MSTYPWDMSSIHSLICFHLHVRINVFPPHVDKVWIQREERYWFIFSSICNTQFISVQKRNPHTVFPFQLLSILFYTKHQTTDDAHIDHATPRSISSVPAAMRAAQ